MSSSVTDLGVGRCTVQRRRLNAPQTSSDADLP